MRYKNREPRPEDVKKIKELLKSMKEQEAKIKELIVRK